MPTPPPEIIMGEGGLVCGPYVLLAIAWVWSRNPRMYGWHDNPSATAEWIAENYWKLPDPTNGATLMFSNADLEKPRVKALLDELDKRPKERMKCDGGYELVFF